MDEVSADITVESGQVQDNGQDAPLMTEDSIKKMKVVEIRDALRHRTLATNGLKADLVSSLVQAVKRGHQCKIDRLEELKMV